MPQPRKGRGKGRAAASRRTSPTAIAHIKTSFNNTIVTITDTDGNVVCWESAGSAGLQGLAQVDAVRRPGDGRRRRPQGHGARPRARRGPRQGRRLRPRHGDPLAAGRRPSGDDRQGRLAAGPQRLPPEEAAEGLADGSRYRTPVQAVPPRGPEAVPEGRALLHREVRRRAPLLPAGRARPRPRARVGVPQPAAREAEGAPLLPAAREAVPLLLREGLAPARRHRREPAAPARAALRQRARAARLRGLAPPGPPADRPRPLADQRPPRRHPQLPGASRRRDHDQARLARDRRGSPGDRADRGCAARGCRPITTP